MMMMMTMILKVYYIYNYICYAYTYIFSNLILSGMTRREFIGEWKKFQFQKSVLEKLN